MNIGKIHTTILRKAKEKCAPFLHSRSQAKESAGQVSGNGTASAPSEPSRLVDSVDGAEEVHIECPPPPMALVKRDAEAFALVPIDAEIVSESSGNGAPEPPNGFDEQSKIGIGVGTKVNGESNAPESKWAGQLLQAAQRAAGSAEAALKEEVVRRNKIEERLQRELADTRRERDELRRRLGAGESDSKRRCDELENKFRKTQEELERVQADIERRTRAEFDLRAELEAAKEAAGYTEAALKDAVTSRTELEETVEDLKTKLTRQQTEQGERFQKQISVLEQKSEELNRIILTERQKGTEAAQRAAAFEEQLRRKVAELQNVKVELEQREAALERSQSTWKEQLDTAIFSKREVEGEFEGAVERNRRLEQEVGNLRRENNELMGKVTAQDRAIGEFQEELKNKQAEFQQTEAELREQFHAAETAKAQVEQTLAESLDRNMRSDQELTTLRQEREDLQAKLTAQQEAAADFSRQIGDLHTHLAQSASELERLNAAAAKQAAEREAAEKAWREELDEAKAHAKKLEADWTEAVQRNVHFEEQLTKQQQESDEAATQMQAARQAAAEATWRADDVERRLGRSAVELENLKTEIAKLNAEKERAEEEWVKQIETQKALTKKLDAAWTAAVERNRGFEAEVAVLREQCEELQAKLGVAKKVVESPDRAASLASLAADTDTLETEEAHPKKQSSKRPAKGAKPARASKARENAVSEPDVAASEKSPTDDAGAILPYNFSDLGDDPAASKRSAFRRRGK